MRVRSKLMVHFFAYAFAIHLLFGSVAVLNALTLTFFFYVPRTIQITLTSSGIDRLTWVTSVAFLSAILIGLHLRHWQRMSLPGIALAVLSTTLGFLLLLGSGVNILQQMLVYALFGVATAQVAVFALNHEATFGQSACAVLSKILIYLLTFFLAIEVSSAVHYVFRSFDPYTQIGRVDAGLELQFSYASYGLLPWLYVAFLFSWAWVPLLQRLIHKKIIIEKLEKTVANRESFALAKTRRWFSTLVDPRFVFGLAVAFFVGYYPYFQNPPWQVGTDARYHYLEPLLRMSARGGFAGFIQALSEWHPAALALLYFVQLMLRSNSFDVVKFSPLFLIVALGLSSWWFLSAGKSIGFGLLAFVLSVLSVTSSIGYYSSILANWGALVVWVLFFGCVCSKGTRLRIMDGVVLLAVSTLILFIHPWTWGVFAVTILLAAILGIFEEGREGLREAIPLVLVIVIDVVVALLSLLLLREVEGRGVADALFYYTYVTRNPFSVLVFWDALTRLTQIWAPFFSPLYLAISIIGVFYLKQANLTPWHRRLIFAWLFVSCVGSVLIAPVGLDPTNLTGSESQLWRLLFLTPIWLTAPFGVVGLGTSINRFFGNKTQNDDAEIRKVWLPAVLVAGVVLVFVGSFWNMLIILVILPAAIGLGMVKTDACESEIVADMLLVIFILVAFNNVTRALSQLLLDPHNCLRC